MAKNLIEGEEDAFILVNETGASPYVLVCEHASNRVPKKLEISDFRPRTCKNTLLGTLAPKGFRGCSRAFWMRLWFCSAIRVWLMIATGRRTLLGHAGNE